jgi:small conductance mechanosensitive channel
LVKTFDANISALRALMAETENASLMDRQALVFREDDRSIQLLTDADALAQAVVDLPEGSAVRERVTQKLVSELRNTSDKIFSRLEELDQHIAKNAEQLAGLSAGARISSEAYLQSLESVRFQYYEALINHAESRAALGMSFEEPKERLKRMLLLHTEALTGQIGFSSTALDDIDSRLKQDPSNADLAAAQNSLNTLHGQSVDHLASAIDLLDRLEVETAEYKAVLLQQSGGVSVSVLQVGVMDQLLGEWMTRAREAVVEHTPNLLFKLLIFFLILFVSRFLSRLTRRVVRASCDRSSLDLSVLLKDILVSASGGTVMVLGIFMALSQIGISLGPMLAGLGVAGFVIGFALQDTLGNFAAGAMILIYRPYDVDDFIEVTGASGLVKKMSLVSTTIVTFDNQTLVIPNSKIWGDVIKNVTAQKVRRVDMEFGIGYNDDIEEAERVLADIVRSHEMVLKAPDAQIKLHTLGDSSVNFVVRPWTKTENYWDVYWDITREVKMRFDREGISIPFPQRDVHLHSETI